MGGYLSKLPFVVVLMGLSALSMLLPAAVALAQDDHFTSRVFFYSSILFLIVTGLVGFATQNIQSTPTARQHLVGLLLAYLTLPLMLAVPLDAALRNTSFINAYVEMISSLTTTGASMFEPERLAPAVHMWRAVVGWFGGFLIWVTAVAVFAPLNLGGYEVTSEAQVQGAISGSTSQMRAASASDRLLRHALKLWPIYVGLTAFLWVLLIMAGDLPLAAAIHAMSTLSTSGISASGGMSGAQSGFLGEICIFAFFVFAVSRRSFTTPFGSEWFERMSRDRELRLAVLAIVILPTLLFARHWTAALEVDELGNISGALSALWGSVFSVLSFLTTTGFISESWSDARAWSGLQTPGLILVGLALMGGGVATTAGGVKLLRVYALYKHGLREMGKLIHPHSVANAGRLGRRIRREGAYIAWIFFMLLILSMASISALFAATGLDFEASIILTISALTTTGPLAEVAGSAPISYGKLSDTAKLLLSFAMVVGRIETLVLIALFNPGFWRA